MSIREYTSYLKSPGKSPDAQAINQAIETKRNDHTQYLLIVLYIQKQTQILCGNVRKEC